MRKIAHVNDIPDFFDVAGRGSIEELAIET